MIPRLFLPLAALFLMSCDSLPEARVVRGKPPSKALVRTPVKKARIVREPPVRPVRPMPSGQAIVVAADPVEITDPQVEKTARPQPPANAPKADTPAAGTPAEDAVPVRPAFRDPYFRGVE